MPDFLISPEFLTIALGLALAGLVFAIFADHLQIIAKYMGSQTKRIAGGYNLAMKVMVANRLGAVLYFLLIGFSIDNGLASSTLAIGLSLAIASLVLPTIGILIWLQRRLNAERTGFRVFDLSAWPRTIVFATFMATVLNLLGLTVPWIASATFPELRLTLANTSFLFNTLFTVINVFYIEHKLAQIVDEATEEIHGFVVGVIFARLMAFLAAVIALLAFV